MIQHYKKTVFATLLLGVHTFLVAENEIVENAEIAMIDEFLHAEIADNSTEKKTNRSYSKNKNTPSYSLGDKNPPYNNPNRFSFEGAVICWRADVDGIDYALGTNSGFLIPSTSSLETANTMQIEDLNFKWNPGFKLGLGVVAGERDEWDVMLRWTWIRNTASRSFSTGPAPDLSPLTTLASISSLSASSPFDATFGFQIPGFSPFLLGVVATSSQTKWHLLYNTIDLEIGRNFFLGSNLTLRSHLGLRGATLHQHTRVDYTLQTTGAFFDPIGGEFVPGASEGNSLFKGTNNFDGIGLRGGLDTRWNFTRHFCLYGSVSGAILFGQFNVKESFDLNDDLVPEGMTEIFAISGASLHAQTHRTRTTLQAALGFMWHTPLNNDKQHLSIAASYEVNEWFQQNELRTIQNGTAIFTANRTSGDLGMNGVTFDISYDF